MSFMYNPGSFFVCFDFAVVSVAFIANILVLSAVVCSELSLPGFRSFLVSLSVADLYMCLVNTITLTYQMFLEENGVITMHRNILFLCTSHILKALKIAGLLANLLNLCGMSADHFIGIVFPLKYRHIVTKNSARAVVIGIWIASFFLAFVDIGVKTVLSYQSVKVQEEDNTAPTLNFSSGDNPDDLLFQDESKILFGHIFDGDVEDLLEMHQNKEYDGNTTTVSITKFLNILEEEDAREAQAACTYFSKMWLELCVLALIALCGAFLVVCYTIIFRQICTMRISSVSRRSSTPSGYRSKKMIITTVIFLTAFVFCWLPFMIFELSMYLMFETFGDVVDKNNKVYIVVGQMLTSVLMLYPLIDPLIYAARIPAVQQSGLLLISRIPCFLHIPCLKRLLKDNAKYMSRSRTLRTSCSSTGASLKSLKKKRVTLNISLPIDETLISSKYKHSLCSADSSRPADEFSHTADNTMSVRLFFDDHIEAAMCSWV